MIRDKTPVNSDNERCNLSVRYIEFSEELKPARKQASIDVVIPNWVNRNSGPDSEAVSMFNGFVRPLIGVKINADGSASAN